MFNKIFSYVYSGFLTGISIWLMPLGAHAGEVQWYKAEYNVDAAAYVESNANTWGNVQHADKDTLGSCDDIAGVALFGAASSGNVAVQRGEARLKGLLGPFASGDRGKNMYVGDNGGLTLTKPSSPAKCCVVGKIRTTDEFDTIQPRVCD